MLDRVWLREKAEELKEAFRKRGEDPAEVDALLELDRRRRAIITEANELRRRRNELSEAVAEAKRRGEDASDIIAKVKEVSARLKELEKLERQLEEEFNSKWLMVPNVPHPSVPEGRDSSDNVVVREWGEEPEFDFEPKAHWDLGPMLGVLDFQRASRMSGSRFVMLRGWGARLARALINFFLDVNVNERGYQEVWPPALVREETAVGTGHLPKFREEMYRTELDGLYLIPTAEVPLAYMHAGETLREEDLPLKYTAYTPCFRREAGSYGKDVRGMIRLHQFDKVELFRFVRPEESYEHLEEMVREAEELVRRLGLKYRVVLLCTGDLGFAAAKTYDIEVWAPGLKRWLEVSSVSNTEDFQARRTKTRLRRADGTTTYPHTLNGSALALPRIIIALLETYQRKDGSVRVPDALIPYVGTELITP